MASSVKSIFKTLLKVPWIIFITYLIFNIFAFGLTYFKLLGFSYVVMQTAVENNYIPPEELDSLNRYLENITDTGVIGDASLVLKDENDSNIRPATEKRQYGMPVTVGVQAQYRFIWPLTPKEQLKSKGDSFIGYGSNTGNFSGYAGDAVLEARREEIADNKDNNINITYTVIGLKYYPDLN